MKKDPKAYLPFVQAGSPNGSEKIENAYYETASARFGIAQIFFFLALFAYIILSFTNHSELITYENFYYFFKDLNTTAISVNQYDDSIIDYPTSEKQSFTLFRKGLAVAGNHSVSVFSSTGKQIISDSVVYQNPVAVGSGKYLLVYDLGGTDYSLYNSYSRIHTGTTEGKIISGKVSASGYFALTAFDSASGKSTVWLYDDKFSPVNRYQKSAYVTDISLNEKGTLLAVLTSHPDGDGYRTELTLYKPGETSEKAVTKLGSGLGISCDFTSASYVSILSEDAVYSVSYTGSLAQTYSFQGRTPVTYDSSPDGISLVLNAKDYRDSNLLLVFDATGRNILHTETKETYSELSRADGILYAKLVGAVDRIKIASGSTERFTCDTIRKTLLALNASKFLLCSPRKAEQFSAH